jgi:hypothetical protein
MEIGGISAIMDTRLAEQLRGRVPARAGSGQGDTVTLSSEAKRLLEYFRTRQVRAMDRDEPGTAASSDAASSGPAGDAKGGASHLEGEVFAAGAGTGTSGGSGTGSQAEDIRKRIKDLMDKVKHIMDSDLPPEQKQSAAAPYLQQIQELQQQLQEMMAAGKA